MGDCVVGSELGTLVGANVGAVVGTFVGTCVGTCVATAGATVGVYVAPDVVGIFVGTTVGASDGAIVGAKSVSNLRNLAKLPALSIRRGHVFLLQCVPKSSLSGCGQAIGSGFHDPSEEHVVVTGPSGGDRSLQ